MREILENFWVDIKKPPNVVTSIRLIFSPLPGLMILMGSSTDQAHINAAILFALIASTDMLDGFLARKLDMRTKLGAFMDPIVDKILVGFLLIGLGVHNPKIFILLAFFVAYYFFVALIMKDAIKKGNKIEPTIFGKVSMACQDVLMVALVLPLPDRIQIFFTAFVIGMTVFSAISYHEKYSKTAKRP